MKKSTVRLPGAAKSTLAAVKTYGNCFDRFLDDVTADIGKQEISALRRKAIECVQNCVTVYSKLLAPGEVGAKGTGAVKKKIRGIPNGTTGLLYGKVQSGKTNASIATVALAKENGFRCFILLTSDNTWLGMQTAKRFRDSLHVDGPAVFEWTEWLKDPVTFGKNQASHPLLPGIGKGLVLVATKNTRSLETILTVLKYSGASRYPTLILDDEADNASLNTKTATAARRGPKIQPSRIFELIGRIRETVSSNIYLQITATPQSLLLQGIKHPCKPSFSSIIEPGTTYMGGDLFFGGTSKHTETVDPSEVEDLREEVKKPVPRGLALALCTFFLGYAQKFMDAEGKPNSRQYFSFLAHISHKKLNHEHLNTLILRFVHEMDRALAGKAKANQKRKATQLFTEAHKILQRTSKRVRPLNDLKSVLKMTLARARPNVINADNPKKIPEYQTGMNILIGGNRLGRGVTIEGLTVTYYGRDAKQKQMDTVHQHARMFGYRHDLKDVTRLFVPDHLNDTFRDIYTADEATREAIANPKGGQTVVPVWTGEHLKPTRSNVLNPADISSFRPGKQIWPYRPCYKRSDGIAARTAKVDSLVRPYRNETTFYEVRMDLIARILRQIPSNHTGGGETWSDTRVQEIIRNLQGATFSMKMARLNVRTVKGKGGAITLDKGRKGNSKGYTSGPLIDEIRQRYPGQLTLILQRQKGAKTQGWDDIPFYLSTIVLPNSRYIVFFSDGG